MALPGFSFALPDLLPALPSLSPAFPHLLPALPGYLLAPSGFTPAKLCISPILPGLSLELQGFLRVVPGPSLALAGTPRHLIDTLRIPACAPRCPYCYLQTFYVLSDLSPVLLGESEVHCISPVNSGIWTHWDSSPTTPKPSQKLPVTVIYFTDVGCE